MYINATLLIPNNYITPKTRIVMTKSHLSKTGGKVSSLPPSPPNKMQKSRYYHAIEKVRLGVSFALGF